ncbi:MAG TPA: hypothetical protein VF760_15170 [Xanthobacteraceae bacterium]
MNALPSAAAPRPRPARVYDADFATIPADPMKAACTAETQRAHRRYEHAQDAVNAARNWVQRYPIAAGELPRAAVTSRPGSAHRNPKNAARLIFHAWRKPNGEYCERRIEKETR